MRASGADGVELDVRRCANGALVVIHDSTFADGRPVATTNGDDRPNDVLLLAEVLDLCEGLTINIEIKNYPQDEAYDPSEQIADDVVAVVESQARVDDVIVSCFGTGALTRTNELNAQIRTAHLVLSRRAPAEVLKPCVVHAQHIVHPYVSMVDAEFMKVARQHNLAVNVWTGPDETDETITDLVALGVDGVITADPSRAVRVRDAHSPTQ
jgi:glycerophosphoryl diester phosphodiesterase